MNEKFVFSVVCFKWHSCSFAQILRAHLCFPFAQCQGQEASGASGLCKFPNLALALSILSCRPPLWNSKTRSFYTRS